MTKNKKEETAIPVDRVIEALRELIKKQLPNVKETIISIRRSLAEGGIASDEDIGQVLYLIEVLEGSQGLRPDEQELLRNLYDDLRKMGGAKYAK